MKTPPAAGTGGKTDGTAYDFRRLWAMASIATARWRATIVERFFLGAAGTAARAVGFTKKRRMKFSILPFPLLAIVRISTIPSESGNDEGTEKPLGHLSSHFSLFSRSGSADTTPNAPTEATTIRGVFKGFPGVVSVVSGVGRMN